MRHVIAFDIETCPQPEEGFSKAQQRRFDKAFRRRRGKKGLNESLEETKAAVRSLSPFLGWICCISLCRLGSDGQPRPAHSYACEKRSGEAEVLNNFWKGLGQLSGRVTWVSFNGKHFDSPYLRLRSLAHDIEPTRMGILNEHRYRDRPHCDLYRYFGPSAGLADACDLTGVPTPKGAMDGSQVWPAIQEGRLSDVVEYCEKDALATLRLYLKARHTLA